MNHKIKLHPDGTLEITMPKGKKASRVLVCEAGTQNATLYYPEGQKESKPLQDDDIAVIFCSPENAEKFKSEDADIEDSLVVTRLLAETECVVVRKDEFLEWLLGEEE